MGCYVETYKGVVYPWYCDQLGHMNVRHYVGMFDEGSFHLLSAGGITMSAMEETGRSFVDIKHVVHYIAEQRVGSLVRIEGCVRHIGNKSMAVFQRMTNSETGELAATTEITLVYFDLRERQSLPIPGDLRESFNRLLVAADDAESET